jgi:sortase (surface protein transpeptidase)
LKSHKKEKSFFKPIKELKRGDTYTVRELKRGETFTVHDDHTDDVKLKKRSRRVLLIISSLTFVFILVIVAAVVLGIVYSK